MIRSIATYVSNYRRAFKVAHENVQWDTFRTLYPLMALHDPVTFSLIVRGMLNIQQHEGKHPLRPFICTMVT